MTAQNPASANALAGERVQPGRPLSGAVERGGSFTYPERKDYRALHAASKTRKLADGRFEAVAAFWFLGVCQNIQYRTGETRHRAERAAMRAIGCA